MDEVFKKYNTVIYGSLLLISKDSIYLFIQRNSLFTYSFYGNLIAIDIYQENHVRHGIFRESNEIFSGYFGRFDQEDHYIAKKPLNSYWWVPRNFWNCSISHIYEYPFTHMEKRKIITILEQNQATLKMLQFHLNDLRICYKSPQNPPETLY